MSERIEVKTADGMAECFTFRPAGVGPHPAVLFVMDGVGLRPAMHTMAERLCEAGFFVLLPNFYHRAGTYPRFDPATVWVDPTERARLMTIMKAVDNAAGMRDVAAFLDVLGNEPGVRGERVGVVGYCFGGRLAFVAAGTYPERVAAAAPIHAGQLVTAAPDSPHLLVPRIRARLYLGVADQDPSCTPEHQATLSAALGAAGVRYQMEVYAGAQHGFAVPDMPPFDEVAAEKHWERVLSLFREEL